MGGGSFYCSLLLQKCFKFPLPKKVCIFEAHCKCERDAAPIPNRQTLESSGKGRPPPLPSGVLDPGPETPPSKPALPAGANRCEPANLLQGPGGRTTVSGEHFWVLISEWLIWSHWAGRALARHTRSVKGALQSQSQSTWKHTELFVPSQPHSSSSFPRFFFFCWWGWGRVLWPDWK